MSVVASDLQELATEFAEVADERCELFIGKAELRCNATYFGDLLDEAVLYLAAHMLAVVTQGSDGAAGAVTSKTVGPMSITYASSNMSSEALGSTSFGREFLEIRKSRSFMAMQVL